MRKAWPKRAISSRVSGRGGRGRRNEFDREQRREADDQRSARAQHARLDMGRAFALDRAANEVEAVTVGLAMHQHGDAVGVLLEQRRDRGAGARAFVPRGERIVEQFGTEQCEELGPFRLAEIECRADQRIAADRRAAGERVLARREVGAQDGREGAAQPEVLDHDELAAPDAVVGDDVEHALQAVERAAPAPQRGRFADEAALLRLAQAGVETESDPRGEPVERVGRRGAGAGEPPGVRDLVLERREHALEQRQEPFEEVGAGRAVAIELGQIVVAVGKARSPGAQCVDQRGGLAVAGQFELDAQIAAGKRALLGAGLLDQHGMQTRGVAARKSRMERDLGGVGQRRTFRSGCIAAAETVRMQFDVGKRGLLVGGTEPDAGRGALRERGLEIEAMPHEAMRAGIRRYGRARAHWRRTAATTMHAAGVRAAARRTVRRNRRTDRRDPTGTAYRASRSAAGARRQRRAFHQAASRLRPAARRGSLRAPPPWRPRRRPRRASRA